MKEVRKVHISVTSNASKNLNKASASATGLSGALKGVGTSANLATGGIRAMATALISSGVGAVVVAVGSLIAGLGTVINKSKAFSKELSALKAVLGSDVDPLSIGKLADDAKRLGASTAFTALQVVQLQTEFAKLGFSTNQILNATEATLNLAAATETDLAEAASVAGATLRGFGLAASETARVTDVMAKSFSKSSLDFSGFTESMKLVAPIAKTLKVPIEQATAAIGTLANVGIKGSMAGTNLRKVMSDLAQKTGLSFRDSLEQTAAKLEKATSDSEKLAIAKELVGDRAKGAVIALAENRDALDELTISLENAGGAAKEMAEERLNNLDGDLTKLGSAFEGLVLSIEDGEGALSSLSRGAVQLLTAGLEILREQSFQLSLNWDLFKIALQKSVPYFKTVWQNISILGKNIQKFGIEAKLALADVPFVGGVVDKENAEKELANIELSLQKSRDLIVQYAKDTANLDQQARDTIKAAYDRKFITREKEKNALAGAVNDEFREGESKKDDAEAKKKLEDKKAFLAKLKKLEQDTEDKTELEKIQRKRERHLAELKTITMNTKERREAEKAINNIYDQLDAEQKAKNRKRFEEMFGVSDDPLAKIQKDQEAHLLALSQLEISETEKEELKLRIKQHYQGLTDKVNEGIQLKKDQEDQAQLDKEKELARQRQQLMYDTLDTAADVAGRESDIGRALLAIKLAMQLRELAMKMKTAAMGVAATAQAAQAEAAVDGAKTGVAVSRGAAETSKVGFPWNVIAIAGYALQAASMIKAFRQSKKKLDTVTGSVGGTASGGAASTPTVPPSFNVIGQTSSGENMIADTIASVNNKPMRAYVVEKDISSSQELQRNTETIASI